MAKSTPPKNRHRARNLSRPDMKTCQISFNLDQLLVWYMKGQLAKKHQKKKKLLREINFSLLSFRLVILLNLKVNVLVNYANYISQKRIHTISASIFLTFVSVDLLYQMTGLSLYVEKLI